MSYSREANPEEIFRTMSCSKEAVPKEVLDMAENRIKAFAKLYDMIDKAAPPLYCSKPIPFHSVDDLPKGSLDKIEKHLEGSTSLPFAGQRYDAGEDSRRLHQATLARWLKRGTACRLLGEDHSKTADGSARKSLVAERSDLSHARVLKMQSLFPKPENHWVKQLLHVSLVLGNQMEGCILGTLEARGSGFTFTSPSFHIHFKDTDVKLSVFRRGDLETLPLLQFHLHDPMVVKSEEMNNIAFLLEATTATEKRKTAGGGAKQAHHLTRNKDLEKFIAGFSNVQWDSRSCFSVPLDLNNFQFDGLLCGGEARQVSVSMTFDALVLLVGCPVSVFPLVDMEIVHLAHVERGFLMTVVFKDFSREVLQISEINSLNIASIKDLLNLRNVKYYCNDRLVDWNSKLREIVECPRRFVDSGGWESLQLEDEHTLSYYALEPNWSWSDCFL